MKKEEAQELLRNSYGDVSEAEMSARLAHDLGRAMNPELPEFDMLPLEKQDEAIKKAEELHEVMEQIMLESKNES